MKSLILRNDKKLGKKVLANKDFNKGEKIIDFKGKIFKREELPNPYDEVEDHYIQVGNDMYRGPSRGFDDLINHSCNPNSGFKFNKNKVIFIAIRHITRGGRDNL